MIKKNIILDTDSYKASHWLQYPPAITNVSSYVEARVGSEHDEIVFFGLQPWLKEISYNRVTMENVEEAAEVFNLHGLPFNREGWMTIVKDNDGILPVSIQAVPEGTVLSPGNVMLQITNTDSRFPWLTSWLETSILRSIWYGTTVATVSREIKKVIKSQMIKTGADLTTLPFKLHDFGFRGVSSWESGVIGGMAHLVNFMGTDTVGALVGAREYYGAQIVGFSIPAAEHSTVTAWGKDREVECYSHMIEKFDGPGKLFAVVSDSYDIYNAVSNIWGGNLKDKVKNLQGTLVIRPDSGNPSIVVRDVLNILGEKFGYSINDVGFKVLPPFVRVIQGDGINIESIKAIYASMESSGWSADNVAFGMGGALLQQVNRDTERFAMKASAISFDSGYTWKDVSKKPVTDLTKGSKPGRLALVERDGKYETILESDIGSRTNILESVYFPTNYVRQSFDSIRKRAEV